MSVKPAHEAPGLFEFERDRIRWAENFAANSSSTRHRELLADLIPDQLPAPAEYESFYPEITGRAASTVTTLLGIISRLASDNERLRGNLTAAEARHAKTAELLGRYAETAQQGADLATDLADARFARYAAEQSGMLI